MIWENVGGGGSSPGGMSRYAGLAKARQLVGALESGWRPSPIAIPAHLESGESCYWHDRVQVAQWLEGSGDYLHKTAIGFGMVGLAAKGLTALGNKSRRNRAAVEYQARYRVVDEGGLYLTDRRFLVQGPRQWTDIWFGHVRTSGSDGEAVYLEMTGEPTLRLQVATPDHLFAFFRWLAHGELAHPPTG